MILRVQSLTKAYAKAGATDRPAVADFSCAVASGELVALMGRSGCGKTTVLKAIAGLIPINGGSISLTEDEAPLPLLAAIVFQQGNCLPWLTVRENVAFPNDLKDSVIRRGVSERIETVGLMGTDDLYPQQLSGGMQQRVAIARFLGAEQPLWLLDEPFASLDPWTKESMLKLVDMRLRTTGKIGLMATHNCEDAFRFATRIILFPSHPYEQYNAFDALRARQDRADLLQLSLELTTLFANPEVRPDLLISHYRV